MTATTTENAPESTETAATHPVSRVAVVGLVVGAVALVATLLGAFGILAVPAVTFAAPLVGLVGILISSFGIAMSHRLQDAFGGTGGYWFALAGLLAGILSLLVVLAAQSFAALD